jgi:hypothetical protein
MDTLRDSNISEENFSVPEGIVNNIIEDINLSTPEESRSLIGSILGSKTVLTVSQQKVFDAYNKTFEESKKTKGLNAEEFFSEQLKFDNKNITTKAFKALQNVFGDVAITDSNCSNILERISTGQTIAGIALQVGTCSRRRSTYQNHCDFNSLVAALDKEQAIAEKIAKLRADLTDAHQKIFGAYNATISYFKAEPKTNFAELEKKFVEALEGDKHKEVFTDCFRGLHATFGNTTISAENSKQISDKINFGGKFLSSLYAAFTLNLGHSSWWNKDAFNKVLILIERDIQNEMKYNQKEGNKETKHSDVIKSKENLESISRDNIFS